MANTLFAFTRQDTLRGSNGRGRDWWDVQRYILNLAIDTVTKSITGNVELTFNVLEARDSMQIDLQNPLKIDSVFLEAEDDHSQAGFHLKLSELKFQMEGNIWWLLIPSSKDNLLANFNYRLRIYYHGPPKIAVMPPWDGGFIWSKDSTGSPWIAVACQGAGASIWWPCKDYGGDEPSDMIIRLTSNGSGTIVGNGMVTNSEKTVFNNKFYNYSEHIIRNPINIYDVTFYAGDYINWTDTIMGEKGKLDLSFYALRYNEARARKQFAIVKQMLHCYEYWMGPYPFYEDGYKLVEAPYLGMEHQSAIAYGNGYQMGYKGMDRTGSGVGNLFDYIIIHESGHEWFGNNITAVDRAEDWIHEGFTTYTETLFAECAFGKEKAFEYTRGHWLEIANDRPVIGKLGVNDEGSTDRYYKGAAVVHMIRMMMGDDERFRRLLRGLNADFYHKTVTSAEVETYIAKYAGTDLKPFFDEYLRTTKIPELEWYIKDDQLFFRFNDVVPGFTLPLEIAAEGKKLVIHPSDQWQHVGWKHGFGIEFPKDYLIKIKA